MNKKAVSLVVLVAAIVWIGIYVMLGKKQMAQQMVFDPRNATYIVDGEPVTLAGGKADVPAAPGSAAKIHTEMFGTPVSGDLNSDGKDDAAIMLSQNSGGSGTFYYVAALINGGKGTNSILLGDRVAPQNMQIENGQIVANYADRKPGEPMATRPSVGVSKYIKYDGSKLVDIAP